MIILNELIKTCRKLLLRIGWFAGSIINISKGKTAIIIR